MSEPDSGPEGTPGRDILAAYRERVLRLMAIACGIFVSPFAVYSFLQGYVALGSAAVTVVAILAIDAIAIHFKKRPPIPIALLPVPLAAAISLSVVDQVLYGALWAYPAVLFCYFALPRRTANFCGLTLSALVAVLAYYNLDGGPEIAVRLMVTLGLTIVFVNIVLNILSQLRIELTDQAVTDPLTGALNRRQMDQSLAEAIERNRRSGAPVTILAIDIDHFKRVNDDFGHQVGDKVLKGLVALIKGRTRKLDRLFRMGGEEFLLLLPDTRANAAMKQADALRKLVGESHLIEQRPVTISIGVAEYWAEQSQESWMQAADDALYQAKAAGRNTVMLGSADSESIPGLSEAGEKRYGRAR